MTTAWGLKDSFGICNGIIGMLEREEADVGLSHIDITTSRKEVVDFSFPYDVADETFATEFSQPFPKYAAFVYPFNIDVWIYIFITYIFSSMILKLLSAKENLSVNFYL